MTRAGHVADGLIAKMSRSEQGGDGSDVGKMGIRVRAPQITIPRIVVLGSEATDVKGVVLNEAQVGVDGLLGLSFLDRFAYRIDRTQHPKLILAPPGRSGRPPSALRRPDTDRPAELSHDPHPNSDRTKSMIGLIR